MAERVAAQTLPTGQVLALELGDLTETRVDAIVNAANGSLYHGGGVAAAIVARGGHAIQAESDAWVRQHGPAGHDRPALTGAGALPARAVIHAVGPIWRGGKHGEPAQLLSAYNSALVLAEAQGFSSLAFPSISTGIFHFPVAQAAALAIQAVLGFCAAHPASALREIRFVLFDRTTLALFRAELERRFAAPQ